MTQAENMAQSTVIALASDHAGYGLKQQLMPLLAELGLTPLDLGTHSEDSVDYPDFADRVANALAEGKAGRGILICGTGIGISIAANRHSHIRAALCHNGTDARLAREHNDANVIAMGARTMGPEVAIDCIRAFMATGFAGGERHERRVGKLTAGHGPSA